MNLNRAMIIGNLTRDPEVRSTASGQTVANFGVATNHAWTDSAGQRQEKTEFHNVVAWAKLADICGQFLAKGRKVYVEGRLQTREWEGQDGVKRYRTEIVAENMIMLDRAGANSGAPAAQKAAPAMANANAGGNAGGNANGGAPEEPSVEEIKVEDIPF